ncbi:hypothetical protein ADUPG1_008344, partial [Aduncisulcus paluster]
MSNAFDRDIEPVKLKILGLYSHKHPRVRDFFRSYDRLRSGFVTEDQFARVLETSSLHVSESDLAALYQYYGVYPSPMKRMINYRKFVEFLEQSGLETTSSSAFKPFGAMTKKKISLADSMKDDSLHRTISMLQKLCETAGINLRPLLKPFDKLNTGKITRSQFFRAMGAVSSRSTMLSDEDLKLLADTYTDGPGIVNYYPLVHMVEKNVAATCPMVSVPIHSVPEKTKGTTTFVSIFDKAEHPTPDLILSRLHDSCLRYGINVRAFFIPHDPRRTGKVTTPTFKSTLCTAFHGRESISDEELTVLSHGFAVDEAGAKYVKYSKVCDIIERMNETHEILVLGKTQPHLTSQHTHAHTHTGKIPEVTSEHQFTLPSPLPASVSRCMRTQPHLTSQHTHAHTHTGKIPEVTSEHQFTLPSPLPASVSRCMRVFQIHRPELHRYFRILDKQCRGLVSRKKFEHVLGTLCPVDDHKKDCIHTADPHELSALFLVSEKPKWHLSAKTPLDMVESGGLVDWIGFLRCMDPQYDSLPQERGTMPMDATLTDGSVLPSTISLEQTTSMLPHQAQHQGSAEAYTISASSFPSLLASSLSSLLSHSYTHKVRLGEFVSDPLKHNKVSVGALIRSMGGVGVSMSAVQGCAWGVWYNLISESINKTVIQTKVKSSGVREARVAKGVGIDSVVRSDIVSKIQEACKCLSADSMIAPGITLVSMSDDPTFIVDVNYSQIPFKLLFEDVERVYIDTGSQSPLDATLDECRPSAFTYKGVSVYEEEQSRKQGKPFAVSGSTTSTMGTSDDHSALLARIRRDFYKLNISPVPIFRSFDPLRSGHVSRLQFQRVLSMCKVLCVTDELYLNKMTDHFTSRTGRHKGMVDYVMFTNEVLKGDPALKQASGADREETVGTMIEGDDHFASATQ